MGRGERAHSNQQRGSEPEEGDGGVISTSLRGAGNVGSRRRRWRCKLTQEPLGFYNSKTFITSAQEMAPQLFLPDLRAPRLYRIYSFFTIFSEGVKI